MSNACFLFCSCLAFLSQHINYIDGTDRKYIEMESESELEIGATLHRALLSCNIPSFLRTCAVCVYKSLQFKEK